METHEPTRDLGPQPLDALLLELQIDNHALVAASGEHLTHKEVAKGRKGRRLSPNLIAKITRAMNLVAPKDPAWQPADLFNYAGQVRRAWSPQGEKSAPFSETLVSSEALAEAEVSSH